MNNDAVELQALIRSKIPLSEHMGFEIRELDLNRISVFAPLEPNVNIHGTGFAGSLYSIAVLTGWAFCTNILNSLEPESDLVVSKSGIRFLKPVTGNIECRCNIEDSDRDQFIEKFLALGKGGLNLKIEIGTDAEAVLDLRYVAVQL